MTQNTLSPSPHLQVEERDQAGQVVARYIASGSNGRVDVTVRLLYLSMGSGQRLIYYIDTREFEELYQVTP
jgi:hypothetical protein